MSDAEEIINVGRITVDTCALFICDLQEKFRPAIYKFDDIVANTSKLGRSQKDQFNLDIMPSNFMI